VDRQKGVALSSARKNRCESRDQQLKYELRAAIKAAIYRIVVKFGDHINEVPVPPEYGKRIQNFLNFLEG
jgi:nucleoporin NDC1